MGEDLLRQAAARKFGGSGEHGPVEVIEHAAKLGIDYRTLVEGCLQDKDPKRKKMSVSLMLWFSASGGVDGAIAESHAAVLGSLVKRLGDATCSKLVQGEPKAAREAALGLVQYDYGLGEEPEVDDPEEKQKIFMTYAKTFRVLAAP